MNRTMAHPILSGAGRADIISLAIEQELMAISTVPVQFDLELGRRLPCLLACDWIRALEAAKAARLMKQETCVFRTAHFHAL